MLNGYIAENSFETSVPVLFVLAIFAELMTDTIVQLEICRGLSTPDRRKSFGNLVLMRPPDYSGGDVGASLGD